MALLKRRDSQLQIAQYHSYEYQPKEHAKQSQQSRPPHRGKHLRNIPIKMKLAQKASADLNTMFWAEKIVDAACNHNTTHDNEGNFHWIHSLPRNYLRPHRTHF
jgi:hypothetical protein